MDLEHELLPALDFRIIDSLYDYSEMVPYAFWHITISVMMITLSRRKLNALVNFKLLVFIIH